MTYLRTDEERIPKRIMHEIMKRTKEQGRPRSK
jgi:hypothetical protein